MLLLFLLLLLLRFYYNYVLKNMLKVPFSIKSSEGYCNCMISNLLVRSWMNYSFRSRSLLPFRNVRSRRESSNTKPDTSRRNSRGFYSFSRQLSSYSVFPAPSASTILASALQRYKTVPNSSRYLWRVKCQKRKPRRRKMPPVKRTRRTRWCTR